jgi:hypothetical protein
MVWFLARGRDFSLLQNVQTSSGVHLPSIWMGTRGSFPRSNVARHEAITHFQYSTYFECGYSWPSCFLYLSTYGILYMAFLYIAVYQNNPHTDTEATHCKQLRLVSVMAPWLDWCKIYEIWLHMIADVINTFTENVFAWSSLSWHYCVEWHQAHWSLFISINMYS